MSRTTLYILNFGLTALTSMENIVYTQPNERQGHYIVCARSFGLRDLTVVLCLPYRRRTYNYGPYCFWPSNFFVWKSRVPFCIIVVFLLSFLVHRLPKVSFCLY